MLVSSENGEPLEPEVPRPGPFRAELLTGRVIVVTGGGSGLGRSMAHRFASLGATVVLAGRRREPLVAVSREIHDRGGRALVYATDVRDPDQCVGLIEDCYRDAGRLDILVNNAAGNFLSRTERLSYRGFRAVVSTVLDGTFLLTVEAGRRWIETRQPGVVLNIVTSYAWTGAPYVVPSACAKAGVLALTRSLAVEWARYGIRLNALAPGPIPTRGAWSRLVDVVGLESAFRDHLPMGRTGRHAELCDLATFLVSDASTYITGQVVTLDGGEWLVGNSFTLLRNLPDPFWEKLAQNRARSRPKS
jgi:NAD(P)-dependent dehydrogenase (short-subunit alcohol dehydrogenase family)